MTGNKNNRKLSFRKSFWQAQPASISHLSISQSKQINKNTQHF